MSSVLTQHIRKSREVRVAVEHMTFIARRPTAVEMLELRSRERAYATIARDFVHGWEGVTENDVVANGNVSPVEFDVALWREWCDDTPRLWLIAAKLLEAYREHEDKVEAAGKA